MLKLFSCFKANKDDRKKYKPIDKNNDTKSNGIKDFSIDVFLTGNDDSGKTKIIEELVASHDPFTQREKVFKIPEIERYIRDSLTDILHAFQQSNDPAVQLEYPENHQCLTYILTTAHESDFDYPIEFFDQVELLWEDAGLQKFLKKSNTYRLPHSAKYFLNRVSHVKDPDYIPTSEDMVYSRLVPSDLFEMSFDIQSERARLTLFEMDLLREEQQKSTKSFSNKAKAIIFVADCSSFNVIIDEKGNQSRLHQSLDLFKSIQKNKWLQTIPVILLLNKQDILAKKIKNGVRFEDYFPDFSGYVLSDVDSHGINPDEDLQVTRAKYFIQDQFLKINLDCHRYFTCDRDITVRLVLDNCRAVSQ